MEHLINEITACIQLPCSINDLGKRPIACLSRAIRWRPSARRRVADTRKLGCCRGCPLASFRNQRADL